MWFLFLFFSSSRSFSSFSVCESPEISRIVCATVYGVSIIVPHFFDDSNVSIKVNLIWTTNLMGVIMGVLGLYYHLHGSFDINQTKYSHIIPAICLTLFYSIYAIGPQRLSNEYAEKIIPKKCYFTMRCMLTTTSWFMIYVITSMLSQLIPMIGVGWLFWFMAIMCLWMSVFVKLFIADHANVTNKCRLVENRSSKV